MFRLAPPTKGMFTPFWRSWLTSTPLGAGKLAERMTFAPESLIDSTCWVMSVALNDWSWC